jgi:hypothetical protein
LAASRATRGIEGPRRVRYILAKTKERRDASQVRRPALRKILQRLICNGVQPARKRVRMELPVPDLGIVFRKPGTQFLKFIR